MYRFMFRGFNCACDTVAELEAVFGVKQPEGKQAYMAWVGPHGDKLNLLLKGKETASKKATLKSTVDEINDVAHQVMWTSSPVGIEEMQNEKTRQKAARRAKLEQIIDKASKKKYEKAKSFCDAVEDEASIATLPFVKGPLTWKVVKRMGKRLGREDLRQLRSDLFSRKKLPV